MAFTHPWLLWALPLALLPLLLERAHSKHYSWIGLLPPDPLSSMIGFFAQSACCAQHRLYHFGPGRTA